MTDPSGPRALPDVIAGRYKVVEQLGAGGMGLVYKAIDTRLDRAVAIKAIHDRRLLQADAAKRLRAEALAAASLDHPYICKVYELIEEADETLLVMELVEGETLTSLLRRGPPPLAQTLQLGREIAEGLAAAHARGLVHRDIKPSNVIVTPHGHVKLLDFGLARIGTTTHAGQDTRTPPAATNPYAGTPFYMAPEQAAGQPITSRADLFSLGVVMFECLSGKLPFEGGAGYDYVRHLLSDHPRQLYRLAPEAPADLVQLVERCLEKTPAARPESAAEVVATLQRLSDSLTRSAVDVRTVSDVRRRRRRSWIGIAAGLAVVAAAAATYLLQPADPTSVLRASRPFVSWPSEEFESRISPDGQWVSFLSARGGAIELFVQRVDGGEPRAVDARGGQAAQPDLVARRPRARLRHRPGPAHRPARRPGVFRGRATASRSPSTCRRRSSAPGCCAGSIARSTSRSTNRCRRLDRVDLASGAVTSITESWKLDGTLQSVDVRPDGKAVVYVLTQNGQDDLWVADVDGANARRLTNDASFERWPLWRGQGATIHVPLESRRADRSVSKIDPRTSRIWALTSSQTQEQPESTSADGRLISFQQSSDDEKVWVVDVASGKSRQLTAGTLSDSAPAWSADGTHLVFQRAQASPTQSALMVDTRLNVAELRDGAIRNEPRALGDGFNALISPDGSAIAYQQLHGRSPLARLVVTELATGNAAIVSEDSTLPTISLFPLEFVEQVFAWNAAGTEIYYADYGDRRTVRRRRANASRASKTCSRRSSRTSTSATSTRRPTDDGWPTSSGRRSRPGRHPPSG